ncbi:MAG: hypothetical protein ACM3ZA_08160 [Bacillota bacterium]
MPGPEPSGSFSDIGAKTMATTASLDELNTLSTAQMMNGLSTLLVSEGLSKLVRDILAPGGGGAGGASAAGTPADRAAHAAAGSEAGPDGAPAEPAAGPAIGPAVGSAAGPAASRDELIGMSSRALGELLTRSLVNRIVDLNTVNAHLAMATSQQLQQMGKRMTTEAAVPAEASSTASGAAPFAKPPFAAPPIGGSVPFPPGVPPTLAAPFPPPYRSPAVPWSPVVYPGWTGPWGYLPVPGPCAPGAPGPCAPGAPGTLVRGSACLPRLMPRPSPHPGSSYPTFWPDAGGMHGGHT